MDEAVRAAAMRARYVSPLAMWFEQALERGVTHQTWLVIKCLDDVRERAQQRWWAPLVQHWKKCLPEGILMSSAMQQYLRRWAEVDAADTAAAVAAAVEAATAP
jgi:hypothetical protein